MKAVAPLVVNFADAAIGDATPYTVWLLNTIGQDDQRGYRKTLGALPQPPCWGWPDLTAGEVLVTILNMLSFDSRIQMKPDIGLDLTVFFIERLRHFAPLKATATPK